MGLVNNVIELFDGLRD